MSDRNVNCSRVSSSPMLHKYVRGTLTSVDLHLVLDSNSRCTKKGCQTFDYGLVTGVEFCLVAA